MSLYLNHFGLREAPFRITPATDTFFTGAQRGNILAALLYAIEAGEGLIKVTGEVGSGKTMLSRMLTEQLPRTTDIIYIATPSLSRDEVLHTLAEELGLAGTAERPGQLLRSLQNTLITRYQRNRRVVAIIDEAHAMPEESLEQIRLLSNLESGRDKLLQIVLFAQPELEGLLESRGLRPLRERITHSFNLPPLDEKAVGAYIGFRLEAAGYREPKLFSPQAVAIIARASAGLTRRINLLADKALLSAFADDRHNVEKIDAKRAVEDCNWGNRSGWAASPYSLLRPVFFAGTLALAAAAGWAARQDSTPVVAPARASLPGQPSTQEPAPQSEEVTTKPPPYVIQLAYAASQTEPGFAAFHTQAAGLLGPDQTRLVPTRIANRQVIALCAGPYKTWEQALAMARQLPESLRLHQPQVRALRHLEAALKNPSHETGKETRIKN